jgi:dihydroxyacetone kinase-like protein
MSTIDVATLTRWIEAYRDAVAEHKDELTDLDRAIGDADHGSNMARGTQAAAAKLEETPPATVADLGKAVGMTLVSTVGGASGPLYGTFFLRFGVGAETGRDATVPLVARKGRASYLGERSAGHMDPGAASTALLLRTLAQVLAA